MVSHVGRGVQVETFNAHYSLTRKIKDMKTKAKRFRVFDIENQKLVGRFDTIEECVDFLNDNWTLVKACLSRISEFDFMIDDTIEDIEVGWFDLMTAWDEGERPEDLFMF